MSTSEENAELVDYLKAIQPYELCLFAGTGLLLYDTMLTFGAEVNVIWRRKFSVKALIHVMNRYAAIAAYVAAVVLLFPVSDKTCRTLGMFEAISTMMPYLAWAVFSALRLYALSEGSIALAVLVFVLNSMYIIPDVYQDANSTFDNYPYPYGCSQDFAPDNVSVPLLWTSRGAMLLGESIVLGWTLKKTGWKRSTRAAAVLGNGCTQTLSDVLLNNGIACFAVPLALNAVTLALDIVATDASLMVGQCIVSFRDALTTNLISRFLLDLGAFGTHQCAPSSETDISDGRDMPTIHFASGVFDAKSRTETETVMMSPTDSELRSGWSGDICGYEMRSRAA